MFGFSKENSAFFSQVAAAFAFTAAVSLMNGSAAYTLTGAVLDEYPLLAPQVYTSVVRPCLADYGGFAIVSGTSNGDDHFHKLKLKAEDDPQLGYF